MADTPNDLQDNGWLSVPWAEYTPGGHSGDAALGYNGGNQASMAIIVNWSDMVQAVTDLCGYSVFNTTTGNLDRTPAKQHPILEWLYVNRITSIRGLQSLGKSAVPAAGLPFVALSNAYRFAVLGVQFTQPRYVILTDAQVDSSYPATPRPEYRRYCSFKMTAKTEVVQRPGGQFTFTEGALSGSKFPQAVNGRTTTASICIKWWNVPRAGWLSNGGAGSPLNALYAMGKINDADFLTYPAGTLRFDTWEAEEIESPVPSQLIGIDPTLQPNLAYDISLYFTYRDPSPRAGTVRGHQLFPCFSPNIGTWAYATDDGTVGGHPLYETVSFPTIFAMNV